ncbi:short-chain fatty acid transporter [Photobacterium sp. 1_MG-2023]|uniref:short-chain fatty acid transporter n=1 Tax=Photobacterium sp. 1_MG-2023 TaxID=3062646 RepID=UPI0026E31EDB|nr:TIGR00366 family protein [Photobacterium sp. 1_MG-2023]MDO6708664.1 TIGR00366 family protein [Photobacterium sp. 1_MG-2023]
MMLNQNTTQLKSKSLLHRFTNSCIHLFERYLPDPLVVVVILTVIVLTAGIVLEGQSPSAMLEYWMGGFWKLHTFAMQMILVLVAGHIVATTPFFMRLVGMIAGKAKTPGQAIVLVTLVSLLASWVNWGIGLVVGAILSKALAKQVKGVDYRLLIASAYSGFLLWHAGLSGSVPLSLATDGHPVEALTGVIPTTSTLFSTFNLVLVAVLLFAIPLTNYLLMKQIDQPFELEEKDRPLEQAAQVNRQAMTPAERLEHANWPSTLICLLGFAALVVYVANGGGLNLNIVIFVLLFAGIALHKNLHSFLAHLNQAVRGASGVIIQFPFYAGVMGMMSQSGLASDLAQFFVNISNADTLPLWGFLSAGLINLFIPSGGGQWAVQGPVLMEAAQVLNADMARVAMAFAWGDSWTNMLQPFWALPALAIAGLKARDIMGYCAIVLLVSGGLIGLMLLLI